MPIAVIACRIFEIMLQQYLPELLADKVVFLDYGLHRVPQKIATSVQAELDSLEQPSLVVIGYGLCGNGITGIRAGQHTLLVPRMDDCITLMLGSYEAYMHEFETEPGTYYLSRGWLESGSHPLKEYEEYRQRYGEEDALWLLDQQYQNYERLVLVAHSRVDLERYRSVAQQVAQFCARWQMRYEEMLGSDAYVRRLVDLAKSVGPLAGAHDYSQLLAGMGASEDFVIIPPGGEIRMAQFIR